MPSAMPSPLPSKAIDVQHLDVLDRGYVKYIEHWGSDERIIEAARMSTGKGFLGWGGVDRCQTCQNEGRLDSSDSLFRTPADALKAINVCRECKGTGRTVGDEGLLHRLWHDKHSSPFEFAGLVLEVKAPIFVLREWHRHRTQSYAEQSARYTPLPDENYMPTEARIVTGIASAGRNKQAQGAVQRTLSSNEIGAWLAMLENAYLTSQACYEHGLRIGIPKELARLPLPVARYTRMRVHTNLRNELAFLGLRLPSDAQWEIRQYADAVAYFTKACYPRTTELFLRSM